jgi:hypothetical protein
MQGNEYPTWIEWLFRSGVGLNCFNPPYALFRQANDREKVQSFIESEIEGSAQLRAASLKELGSEDPRRVERAIFYLMLVGLAADIPVVEALRNHPEETIRKGAKTCRFELAKRQVT